MAVQMADEFIQCMFTDAELDSERTFLCPAGIKHQIIDECNLFLFRTEIFCGMPGDETRQCIPLKGGDVNAYTALVFTYECDIQLLQCLFYIFKFTVDGA